MKNFIANVFCIMFFKLLYFANVWKKTIVMGKIFKIEFLEYFAF